MYFLWLSLLVILAYYKMCNLLTKIYDVLIAASFAAFCVSLFEVGMFVSCVVFTVCTVLMYGYIALAKALESHNGKGKCILLCEAGQGIFAVLYNGKVEIGVCLAEKEYRAGDVVSIENYTPCSDVAVSFI